MINNFFISSYNIIRIIIHWQIKRDVLKTQNSECFSDNVPFSEFCDLTHY